MEKNSFQTVGKNMNTTNNTQKNNTYQPNHTLGLIEWSMHINEGYWQPRDFDILIIELLQYAMQGKCSKILLSVPPRHGKSTLISKNFISYFMAHFPEEQVILTSYSQELASEFGSDVKNILDMYGYLSPYNPRLSKSSKSKKNFHLQDPYNGRMKATGSYGSILGFGAGVFVIDDPLKNIEEANSPKIQRRLQRWYTTTARTRLEKRENGLPSIMIVIAQRLHIKDLQGIIKEKEPYIDAKIALQKLRNGEHIPENTWIDFNLPALATEDNDILGRYMNEPLWAEQKNYEALQSEKETMGTYLFNAIYQGNPRIPEGNMFKRKWFYDKHDKIRNIIPHDTIPKHRVHRYFDVASGGPEGDETSGYLTSYDGTNMYILHAHNNHYWPNELARAVIRQTIDDNYNYNLTLCKIEQEGGSHSPVLINQIQHDPKILKNSIRIRADNVRKLGNKRDRASQLVALAEFNHLYWSDQIPLDVIEETIEQLIDFTGEEGKHDDRVDSLSGNAREWMTKRTQIHA